MENKKTIEQLEKEKQEQLKVLENATKAAEALLAKKEKAKAPEAVEAQPAEIAKEEDEFEKAKRRIQEGIEKTAEEESRKFDEKHGFAPKEKEEKPTETKEGEKEEPKAEEKTPELTAEEKEKRELGTKHEEARKKGDKEEANRIENEIFEKFVKKEKAFKPIKEIPPEPAKETPPEPVVQVAKEKEKEETKKEVAGKKEEVATKFDTKKAVEEIKTDIAKKEEENSKKFTPEEKQKLAQELYLKAKEKFQNETIEKSSLLKNAWKKTEKWWGNLDNTKTGKIAKVAASAALIGGATFGAGTLLGIAPPSGITGRLLARVGVATGLNMALTSNLTQKFFSVFKIKKPLTFGNIAMVGGVGAAFLLGGPVTAAIAAGGIVARKTTNYFFDKKIKDLEEKIKNLSGKIEAKSFDDSYDVNKFVRNLNMIGQEYDHIAKSLKRFKWGKNIVNGALTMGAGLATMASFDYEKTPEQALADKAPVPITETEPEIPKAEEVPITSPEEVPVKPEEVPVTSPEEVPVKPEVESVPAPEIHGVQHDVKFTLGKEGVPASLERTFHSISADHMELGAGEVANEEFGAKSLNMAANLVRLAEGHNVAGISSAEFEQVAHFDPATQTLEIKDHAGFNNLVEKLEGHANELWDKGSMEGAKVSLGNIKDETFLKIVHAEGMDKGIDLESGQSIETGIIGHDDVGSVEISHEGAEIHEAGAEAPGIGGAGIPETMNEAGIPQEAPTGVGIERPPEEEVIKTPVVLSPEILEQVKQTYDNNINHLFGDKTTLWDNVKDSHLPNLTADKMMHLTIYEGLNEDTKNLVSYLNELHDVTGLNPIEGTLITPAETNSEYITRALQKAAEMGKLDKVIL